MNAQAMNTKVVAMVGYAGERLRPCRCRAEAATRRQWNGEWPGAGAESAHSLRPAFSAAGGTGLDTACAGCADATGHWFGRSFGHMVGSGYQHRLSAWPAENMAVRTATIANPFYVNGPNDMGVGWNVYYSLKRVGLGFGLAVLVGIPLGFLLGRFAALSRAFNPIISLLRPVSPLAWLPIGLAVFQAANPAAVFTIFICSIWPMIINTAVGVASVPQDYLNVARVLNLSEWKVFTRILLPATVPFVLTGAKLALGIAWLVIVASEMLTGGTGIGFWVWDEWNNLNMEHIIIAIFIIGSVGLLLEIGMSRLAARFDYRGR